MPLHLLWFRCRIKWQSEQKETALKGASSSTCSRVRVDSGARGSQGEGRIEKHPGHIVEGGREVELCFCMEWFMWKTFALFK